MAKHYHFHIDHDFGECSEIEFVLIFSISSNQMHDTLSLVKSHVYVNDFAIFGWLESTKITLHRCTIPAITPKRQTLAELGSISVVKLHLKQCFPPIFPLDGWAPTLRGFIF